MAKKTRSGEEELFIEETGQLRLTNKSAEQNALANGSVECLGMTFDSEDARRTYFTDCLRAKLADPEFRKLPGFPMASDEQILRISDPPFYTACPNPFLDKLVEAARKTHGADAKYEREPFAVDIAVGKTDQLFQLHSYHTKVPYLAIAPTILHYTRPGDVVLDGFCGSGMTGVAAQWCEKASNEYRLQLEQQWRSEGLGAPEWGRRFVILNDLGPAATFIAANYNLPFNIQAFEREAQRIFEQVSRDLGWMYETLHTDGKTTGRINYTVWGEVFSCPECAAEVNFLEEALADDTRKTLDKFPCPSCKAELTKNKLERFYVTAVDGVTGETVKTPKRKPLLINYRVGAATFEKKPSSLDLERLEQIASRPLPVGIPNLPIPYMHMTHERARMDKAGVTSVHHFFLPRALHALAALWREANSIKDGRLRNMLIFLFEQGIWTMAVLNRFQPQGYKQVNKFLNGVYYVPSVHCEVSPWYALEARADRIARSFAKLGERESATAISTGHCGRLLLENESIDYIFTDPPFGENIYYADLNFLVEAWHGVLTNAVDEAIVDQAKKKGVHEYQELMRSCFLEYYRVLKPGRWMTVVFSNSSNAVWRAIQEAMGTAGFVVADVRTLDKKQGSYRQVTSTAVKQDLVISVYKPSGTLASRFSLGASSPENTWAFIAEHLRHVPVFSISDGVADVIAERTAQVLHDRMVAFHVQRQMTVPVSTSEFLLGLNQRFPERDGMYFLPHQVAEYDRKRMTASELRQLNLFVTDEASAIQWVRKQLHQKPCSFQDLQPVFMREIQNWSKHEQTVELREILRQNFLHFDGQGTVPSQIHSYLSTNFKDLRNLPKDDPVLVVKAADRWYVPDPNKQSDLEKLREKTLLAEFEQYKNAKEKKLKLFRTEAVRAGFKAAYEGQDYRIIVSVAAKLPEGVLQEDEKLLMYYDVASMRLGEE